MEVLDSAVYFI